MAASINTKTCETCEHFDPVLRGQTSLGGVKETAWGWCAKRSIYPHYEGPGQRFPSEVKRAEPGALASPYIVRRSQIVPHCNTYEARTPKPSKAALLKQLQAQP